MSDNRPYVGNELDTFRLAGNWKRYWSSFVVPFLRGDVLEIGAGIGANLSLLCGDAVHRWICLEPDVTLCQRIDTEIGRLQLRHKCHTVHGTLSALPERDRFDVLLYLDVLEHILDDAAERRD